MRPDSSGKASGSSRIPAQSLSMRTGDLPAACPCGLGLPEAGARIFLAPEWKRQGDGLRRDGSGVRLTLALEPAEGVARRGAHPRRTHAKNPGHFFFCIGSCAPRSDDGKPLRQRHLESRYPSELVQSSRKSEIFLDGVEAFHSSPIGAVLSFFVLEWRRMEQLMNPCCRPLGPR